MKMIKLALIGAILLTIGACATFQENAMSAAQLSLNAKAADLLIQDGMAVSTVMTVRLGDAEVERIDRALDRYGMFRAKWKGAVVSPETAAISLLTLKRDYDNLRSSYMDVYNIIQSHWDEYDEQTRFELLNYHMLAINIDEATRVLIGNQQQTQAINTALQYATLIAKVAVL